MLLFYLSQPILGTAVETVGGDGDDRLPKQASLSQRITYRTDVRADTLSIGQSSLLCLWFRAS